MLSPIASNSFSLKSPVCSMAHSLDGDRLAVGLENHKVVVLSPSDGDFTRSNRKISHSPDALAISNNSVLIAADFDTMEITIWGDDFEERFTIPFFPICVAISDDGNTVAVGANRAYFWICKKGEYGYRCIAEGSEDEYCNAAIGISRSGKVALGTSKGSIELRDATGVLLHQYHVDKVEIESLRFSSCGNFAAECRRYTDKEQQIHLFHRDDHSIVEATRRLSTKDFVVHSDTPPPSPLSDRASPVECEPKQLSVSPNGSFCVTTNKEYLSLWAIEGKLIWKEPIAGMPCSLMMTNTWVVWVADEELYVRGIEL